MYFAVKTISSSTCFGEHYCSGIEITYRNNISEGLKNTAISGDNGLAVEIASYDAWGARRAPTLQTILSLSNETQWSNLILAQKNDTAFEASQLKSSITTKGYTGHEMLDDVGLIHMNGRVYDPQLGRFLSADPVIQDASDMQAYNRYSYVRNNPLTLTDPSGYSWVSKTWKKVWHNKIARWALMPS